MVDGMQLADLGLTPDARYFRVPIGNSTPAITYLHLYECENFSVSEPSSWEINEKKGLLCFCFHFDGFSFYYYYLLIFLLSIADGDILLATIRCHSTSQPPWNDGF